MHSTIHAVCEQQRGQNRAKSHVTAIKKIYKKKFVKRAGRHFGFLKRAGRRALLKRPMQNTAGIAHELEYNSAQSNVIIIAIR